MFSRAAGWIRSSSGTISLRISPRVVAALDESTRNSTPALAAECLGLLAPERQQRADDTVLAARLDPLRAAARDEPVEDRLDLVARGVPGRAQAIGPCA